MDYQPEGRQAASAGNGGAPGALEASAVAQAGTLGSGSVADGGLARRLDRVARALRRAWAGQLAGLYLTPPQAAILRGVAGAPGCSLRALARTLEADPMNAKRCVDELEQRELLRSGNHPDDRRPRTLTLTSRGHALVVQVEDLARRHDDWLGAALGSGESARVASALAKLDDLVARRDGTAARLGALLGHHEGHQAEGVG